MPNALKHLQQALRAPVDGKPRSSAWLGKLLVGRRAVLLAPFFVAALVCAFRDPERPPFALALSGAAVVILCYLLRIWAAGYRTWVRKSGAARYLMSAGPYAHVRHPLYVVNGIAGAAALAALGRFGFLAAYVPLYLVMIAFVILREEEVLAERFGDEHARYRLNVPAFFPRPWRRQPPELRKGEFHWKPVLDYSEIWKLLGVVATVAFFVVRPI